MILHEDCAAVDVHVQFQHLFEQFYVGLLGSVHSAVSRNGIQTSSATARHGTQIIWLGGCFIVARTYFLSKHLPNGYLMCIWRGTSCVMVHSSENNYFFYSARIQWRWHLAKFSLFFFIIGIRGGFRASRWDFSPNYFLRRLETMLKLIAVHFKRKIARIF